MTQKGTILVVEDQVDLANVLMDYLHASDYATAFFAEGNGVVESVQTNPPDLILLDLMLPGKDGIQICREVRAFSEVPIIMLTARVEEIDRLLGLELGADDYVCKPYSPREVIARVRAVLRRANMQDQDIPQTGLVLDEDKMEACFNCKKLDLTPVEFRLLLTLFNGHGTVYSRNHLIDRVYDDHRVVSDRTVDTHIKNLRRKLREVNEGKEMIRSIYGVGFKFELSE